MNEVWVLSVKTSLPGVCNIYDDLKEEISAYSSFEKAKCALRAKLNEIIATPNSMFGENGHIKMLNKYVENLPEDDKEFNEKFEQIAWAKTLSKEIFMRVNKAIATAVLGKDLHLEIEEDKYTDYWKLLLKVDANSISLRGIGDGPCNDINPIIDTNIFSMVEPKDYYMHIVDKLGQMEFASELYVDLRKLVVE